MVWMRIILQNIKNLLRRPLVFCILVLGLIVGSFAQVVYCVSCTKEIRLGQVTFNRHKVVEFIGVFDEAATRVLTEMILDGSLPEIQYAGFVSYQKRITTWSPQSGMRITLSIQAENTYPSLIWGKGSPRYLRIYGI